MINPATSPGPAMWFGLMMIGIAIWMPWLYSIKWPNSCIPPMAFLAVWTIGASVLTAYTT